jgi:hypothetical protein
MFNQLRTFIDSVNKQSCSKKIYLDINFETIIIVLCIVSCCVKIQDLGLEAIVGAMSYPTFLRAFNEAVKWFYSI